MKVPFPMEQTLLLCPPRPRYALLCTASDSSLYLTHRAVFVCCAVLQSFASLDSALVFPPLPVLPPLSVPSSAPPGKYGLDSLQELASGGVTLSTAELMERHAQEAAFLVDPADDTTGSEYSLNRTG